MGLFDRAAMAAYKKLYEKFLDSIIFSSRLDVLRHEVLLHIGAKEMNKISRDNKRKFSINEGYEMFKQESLTRERISNYMHKIKDAMNGNAVFENDSEFVCFLTSVFLFQLKNKDDFNKKLSNNFIKEFIKEFVLESKKANAKISFIEYFDDAGEIIDDKVLAAYGFLHYLLTESEIHAEDEDIDYFVNSLLPNELVHAKLEEKKAEKDRIAEQMEEARLKRVAEYQAEKERKRAAKLAERERRNTGFRVTPITIVKTQKSEEEKLRETFEKDKFRQYFDNGESLEELKSQVRKDDKPILTKAEWNAVVDTYNKSLVPKRIERVKEILGGEKELRELLRSSSLDDYNRLLESSNFDSMTDEDILNEMIKLSETNSNVDANLKNIIVFPTDTFVEEQKDRITNSRAGINVGKEIKAIVNQLEAIKSTTTKFIELIYNGKPYVFDKCKAYVYGNAISRVCFLSVYVDEANKRELQLTYPQFTKVLLVFGMSSTNMERDTELYGNAVNYLNGVKSKFYSDIYNIFAYPFTEETRKQAFDLINNSMIQMGEFAGDEISTEPAGNVKKKDKNKKGAK